MRYVAAPPVETNDEDENFVDESSGIEHASLTSGTTEVNVIHGEVITAQSRLQNSRGVPRVEAIAPAKQKTLISKTVSNDPSFLLHNLPSEIRQKIDKVNGIASYEATIGRCSTALETIETRKAKALVYAIERVENEFAYEKKNAQELIERYTAQIKTARALIPEVEVIKESAVPAFKESIRLIERMPVADRVSVSKTVSATHPTIIVSTTTMQSASEVEVTGVKVKVPSFLMPRMKIHLQRGEALVSARDSSGVGFHIPFLPDSNTLQGTAKKICMGDAQYLYNDAFIKGDYALALTLVLNTLRTCIYAVSGYSRADIMLMCNRNVDLHEHIPQSGESVTVLCPRLWTGSNNSDIEPNNATVVRYNEEAGTVQLHIHDRYDDEINIYNSPSFITYDN
jgi:hypothetical protein